jgi:hypothetical protein
MCQVVEVECKVVLVQSVWEHMHMKRTTYSFRERIEVPTSDEKEKGKEQKSKNIKVRFLHSIKLPQVFGNKRTKRSHVRSKEHKF